MIQRPWSGRTRLFLRCRSDDSAQSSHIWSGAKPSKSVVDTRRWRRCLQCRRRRGTLALSIVNRGDLAVNVITSACYQWFLPLCRYHGHWHSDGSARPDATFTGSHGRKDNTGAWLAMMVFTVPSLGAELGRGRRRSSGTTRPRCTIQAREESSQDTQDAQTPSAKRYFFTHPTVIGRVIVRHAHSPDLNPLDTWNASKREMYEVRGRVALKAEAARAWAAVRAPQFPARLLRDWEDRLALCKASAALFEHISNDSVEQ